MNILKFIIYIIILSFPIISCGLPDVTGVTLELNQPYITKITPGNNKLTVEFEAQNNEPSFSGYNIYFGDNTNPRKYRLYNQQKALPTIADKTSQVTKKYSFTIETGAYFSTNSADVYTLKESDLNNGVPIYVWVSSYQITPQLESYYYDNFVKMGTPRPEALNQTITPNTTLNMEGRDLVRLVENSGALYFQNTANSTMMMVAASSLDDVVIPPENGYGNIDLQVKTNRLYLIKITDGNNAYYGKIYVRSVNGTSSITADYCRQTAANILSY